MAAFGEYHRTGKPFASPIAADKAMRHVPIGDVLAVFDRDNVTKPSRVENVVQRAPEGGIAQDVTDLENAPVALCRLNQLNAACQCVCHWLLKQNMVVGIKGGDGGSNMH